MPQEVFDFDVEIQGLAELEAKLESIEADVDKLAKKAANFALTPVVKTARQKALVAKEPHEMHVKNSGYVKVKPGLLAESIRKKMVPKRELVGEFANGIAVGVYVGKGQKQKLYPRYWHIIEHGSIHMQATPYLRPAFDENLDLMVKRFYIKFERDLNKLIEQMN